MCLNPQGLKFFQFGACFSLLHVETLSQLLLTRVTRLDPATLTMPAFNCFKNFMTVVNTEAGSLQKSDEEGREPCQRTADLAITGKRDPCLGLE